MQFNQDRLAANHYIQAHAEGEITVLMPPDEEMTSSEPGLRILRRSFIISPRQLLTDWAPQTLEQLEQQHIALTLEMKPELVILGVAPRLQFPNPIILSPLMENSIGYEVMEIGAACRTYNVLAAEGRQVVTALLIGKKKPG
ncbi:MAG: hypothetical protein KAJ19_03835 [Gammaproteobacteria bacterium]|nr:hypothetical protein [Gammaproteobacteria bacterium]